MRRPPNFTTSQWLRTPALWKLSWTLRSACSSHPQLPWTADERPPARQLNAMHRVCEHCPVLTECAGYALRTNNGRGADGGFYAGTWVPWLSQYAPNRDLRVLARRQLRALLSPKRRTTVFL